MYLSCFLGPVLSIAHALCLPLEQYIDRQIVRHPRKDGRKIVMGPAETDVKVSITHAINVNAKWSDQSITTTKLFQVNIIAWELEAPDSSGGNSSADNQSVDDSA
jgi:hypothetical protein